MTDEKEILRFKGSFNSITIDHFLKDLERWCKEQEFSVRLTKRIYSIVVEVITNIHHHSHILDAHSDMQSYIEIHGDSEKVYVETGNVLFVHEVVALKERIDILNQMRDHEIKDLYLNKVMDTEISEKGGAGLGLITILKTTRDKIIYKFTPVNENLSYITMIIPLNKTLPYDTN